MLRIAVTLVVAGLSYLWLERPIRVGNSSPRRLALAGGVGVALVSLLLMAGTDAHVPTQPQLDTARMPAGTDREGRLDLVLIGDSVAEKLGPALEESAEGRGLRSR